MDDGSVNDKINGTGTDEKNNPRKFSEARKSSEPSDPGINMPWISQNNNNNVNQPSAYKLECNGIAADESTISLNNCAYNKKLSIQTDDNCSEKQETIKSDEETVKRVNGLCNGIIVNRNSRSDANEQIDFHSNVISTDYETLKSDDDDNNELDSSSTDNLSFASEDGFNEMVDNGIINDIILLPNNLISEDELSTSSDDCVYAYRGADFDPVPENTEDENDFLEMDFEPDPASEIEQENNAGAERNIPPLFEQPVLVELSPNALRDIQEHESTQQRKIAESSITTSSQNKERRNQTDISLNVAWKDNEENRAINGIENVNGSNRIVTNNSIENTETRKNCFESNNQENITEPGASCSLASVPMPALGETYYDQTISLSSKKYTGTIPKTNRLNLIIRPNRLAKSSSSSKSMESQTNKFSDCTQNNIKSTTSWVSRNHDACKRWKINEDEGECSSSIPYREANQSNIFNSTRVDRIDFRSEAENMPFTSFSKEYGTMNCGTYLNPNDIFSIHTHEPSEQNRTLSSGDRNFMNHTMDSTDYYQMNENAYNVIDDYDTSFVHETVTIYSIDCTIDTIVKALSKMDIIPDLEILRCEMSTQHHSQLDPAILLTMNIPEYLVYMSKLNCNYKAIISAIKLACKSQELDINFFPTESIMLKPEVISVPVCDILDKLPNNGSLRNILAIRNKQFHKANVLGKIVNVIRKFSDMRHDIIKENYITVPQYYRSGYICISKIETNNNNT